MPKQCTAFVSVTRRGKTLRVTFAIAVGLKTVADHLGLQHQIFRAHVNRNVHDLVAALGTKALEHPDPVPWELPALTVDQFLEDLDRVEWILKSMPAHGQTQLQALAARYQGAPPPSMGKRATMLTRHHAPCGLMGTMRDDVSVVSHASLDTRLGGELGALGVV